MECPQPPCASYRPQRNHFLNDPERSPLFPLPSSWCPEFWLGNRWVIFVSATSIFFLCNKVSDRLVKLQYNAIRCVCLISFKCLGSDFCYCRKQLCGRWASRKKRNQSPTPIPRLRRWSPLLLISHRKLNCLQVVSKGKGDVETGYSQVLSEAGEIAKDPFHPCLGGGDTHTYRGRGRVRKQLRIYLVFVWLEFQLLA